MGVRASMWLVVAAAGFGAGIACQTDASCDRPTESGAATSSRGDEAESAGEREPREAHPAFRWDDALGADAGTMEERLGPPEDGTSACKPGNELGEGSTVDRLPLRGLLLGAGCVYSGGEGDGAYRIVGAVYDDSRVAAVRIAPTEDLEMDAEWARRFGLPDVPLRRRSQAPTDDGRRSVESYRVGERPDDAEEPIGYDAVSVPGNSDTLAYIQVYSAVSPLITRSVTIRGPVHGDGTTLPETRSELEVRQLDPHGMFVRVGLDSVRVGFPPSYPAEPTDGGRWNLSPVDFAVERAVESPVTAAPYREVYRFLEQRTQFAADRSGEQGSLGGPSEVVFVGADRSARFGHVTALTTYLARAGYAKLKVYGRPPSEPSGVGAHAFRVVNFVGRAARPPRDAYVGLHLSEAGIDVYESDARVEPIEGCPGDGPTVCIDGEPGNMQGRSGRGGDGANGGGASDDWAAAFPWARLYNVLVDLEPTRNTMIVVRAGAEMPWGLALRAMDVARYRRAASEETAEECLGELEPGQWSETAPCASGGASERPRRLVGRPLVVRSEYRFRPPKPAPRRPVPAKKPDFGDDLEAAFGGDQAGDDLEAAFGGDQAGDDLEAAFGGDQAPEGAGPGGNEKRPDASGEQSEDASTDDPKGAEGDAPSPPETFVSLPRRHWRLVSAEAEVATDVPSGSDVALVLRDRAEEAGAEAVQSTPAGEDLPSLTESGPIALEPGEVQAFRADESEVRELKVGGGAMRVGWHIAEEGTQQEDSASWTVVYLQGDEPGTAWLRVVGSNAVARNVRVDISRE